MLPSFFRTLSSRTLSTRLASTSSRPPPPLYYLCGPTVYSSPHLGHLRTHVSLDYLIRVQRHKAPLLRPILAIGCTDIDDKIVKRAKEEKMEMGEITRKYEREFYDALKWAGCEEPDVILRVTEHIGDIIAFIRVLVDNGNAYVLENDGVYFDTSAMDSRKEKYGMGYGGWFNRGLEFQSDGFESEKKRDGKKNERDFALWKIHDTIDEHNYSYPSPFGRGRPGWHIECSAMIKKFEVTYSKLFGKKMVVSLHGGGKDLIFPHHENEVAQSTTYEAEYEDSTDNNSNSLTSRPGGKWIEEWIHTGHLNVKGGKMSKSDKTGVSYQSLGCHGDVFRWWVLADSGRWDQDAVFEERRVSEAEGKLETIRNFISADVDELVGASTDDLDLVAAVRAAEDSIMDEIEKPRKQHDSGRVLREVFNIVKKASNHEEGNGRRQARGFVSRYLAMAGFSDFALGSDENSGDSAGDESKIIEVLSTFRNGVRSLALENPKQNGRFLQLSDEVRDALDLKDGAASAASPIKQQKTNNKTKSFPVSNGLNRDGSYILPKLYFRNGKEYEGLFSKFDSTGVPTTAWQDGEERELSDGEREQLQKIKDVHTGNYWGRKPMNN